MMDNPHSEVVLRRSSRLVSQTVVRNSSNTPAVSNQVAQQHQADTLATTSTMATQRENVILRRSRRLASTEGSGSINNSINAAAAIETLTPFTRTFPPELLLRIFNYALPGPRIVIVRSKVVHNIDEIDMEALKPSVIKILKESEEVSFEICTTDAETIPTPLLHVCFTSRQLALKHYSLAFKAQFNGKPIYFDFKLDTLYLWSESTISAFFGHPSQHRFRCLKGATREIFKKKAFSWKDKIQHVASSYMLSHHHNQKLYIYKFPQLETLEMIVPRHFFNGCMRIFNRATLGFPQAREGSEEQYLTIVQDELDSARGNTNQEVQVIVVYEEMMKARIRAENPRTVPPDLETTRRMTFWT